MRANAFKEGLAVQRAGIQIVRIRNRAQLLRQIAGVHRHAESRAHGGPQRLGRKRISRARAQQQRVKACRIQRAQHGTHIAGVLHAVQRGDFQLIRRKRLMQLRQAAQRRHPLRGFRIAYRPHRAIRQHINRQVLPLRRVQMALIACLLLIGNQQRRGGVSRQGLAGQMIALGQKQSLLRAGFGILERAPSLHQRVLQAGNIQFFHRS